MKRLQVSFSGGEISPSMQGRIDARDYQNGLAECSNFVVRPQGSLERRAGFQYVSSSFSQTHASRLIPFVYSDDQAQVIEMSEESIRLWREGQPVKWATPVGGEIVSWDLAVNEATYSERHGLEVGDWIKFTYGPVTTFAGMTTDRVQVTSIVDAYTIGISGGLPWFTLTPATPIHCWKQTTDYDTSFPIDFIKGSTSGGGAVSVVTFDHTNNKVIHGSGVIYNWLNEGDTVRFVKGIGTVVIPTWLSTGTTYYVRDIVRPTGSVGDFGSFKVALTKGGDAVAFSSNGSGSIGLNRKYLAGELVYVHSGRADGYNLAPDWTAVWCCKADVTMTGPWSAMKSNFYIQPRDGSWSIETPYAADDVSSIGYTQSNDVITFAHPKYAPRELRRHSNTRWELLTIAFQPTLDAPTGLTKSTNRGTRMICSKQDDGQSVSTGVFVAKYWLADNTNTVAINTSHSLVADEVVYIDVIGGNMQNFTSASDSGYYYINLSAVASGQRVVQIRKEDGTVLTCTNTSPLYGTLNFYQASSSAEREQTYIVSAVDDSRNESKASTPITCDNILDVVSSSNTINWDSVPGAVRYRIYRKRNGLYGLIGETDELTFTDENESADMGITPLILDEELSGTDYPRAVGYFEQRRVFAGTTLRPRQLWMTRTATESDLGYTIPVQDTNRISVALAAREATTIRHIVPLQDLLLITQQGEWRMFSANSDAISPETIAVRQQSEVGGSYVRPLVVNNNVVYPAVRGGHVRHLNFSWQTQGYQSGNLSLRASHLFDNYTIKDATFQRSPFPIAWFASSSGNLLACTYLPEEEVTAWHQHLSGDAKFESVCSVAEGEQDTVYAVVVRTVNGAAYRTIERMVPEVATSLDQAVMCDASTAYRGGAVENTAGASLTISGGTSYAVGDVVRVTSSVSIFGAGDVGRYLKVTSGDDSYEMKITASVDATKVDATLVDVLPASLRNTAQSAWMISIVTMTATPLNGLGMLNNSSVQVVQNGTYIGTKTLSSTGTLTFTTPTYTATLGLPYESTLQTLPQSFPQAEAAGQGTVKNVSDVWLRVKDSAGLSVGSDANNLVPVQDMTTTALSTGELETAVPAEYTQSGQIMVRQSSPLPATILNITLETVSGD